MNEKEKGIKFIMEQSETLPDEAQRAISWLIKNIDIVDELTKNEKLTKEEIATLIQNALEKKDYISLVMVLYKQNRDQTETET